MKIFKNWENNISALVIFLGKDVIVQKRRMRSLYKQCFENGDINAYKQYYVQLGSAMQTSSIYNITKIHFNLDSFNRKHIITKNEKENTQENSN
jgi:hypothetical protein